MEKSFFITPSFVIIFMMLLIGNNFTHPYSLMSVSGAKALPRALPLPPDTALTHTATTSFANNEESARLETHLDDSSTNEDNNIPVRVIIPSIKLDTSIVSVGLNAKGEMDVPSGKTKNVGWYEDGTVPGELGSAVLDAHVFAAFARLRELKEGADVYVVENNGNKLHFKVTFRKVYPLADVPLKRLFLTKDAKMLNLITCAGSLTRNRSTYDHRLIVYTTLVDDTRE